MTDNANEATKMKPRVAAVVRGWFGGGGLLGPFFFFSGAFGGIVGLG